MIFWPTHRAIIEASLEVCKMRHPSGADKPAPIVLTAADRCDRCPAAAGYRVQLKDNILDLDLCMHHFREHFPEMATRGWQVIGATEVVT